MMKYPCLVLKSTCTTLIDVTIEREGISEDGEPLSAIKIPTAMCNYQDKAKRILTNEQKLVLITGRAFFMGDIAPEVPVISGGEAVVFGVKRRIVQGVKARNPDGTVNYTQLDLE